MITRQALTRPLATISKGERNRVRVVAPWQKNTLATRRESYQGK